MANNGGGMKMFLSFITGAALGAIFGVLFAPQPGTETRKKVRDLSDRLTQDFKEEYSKMSGKAKTLVDETKGKIQDTRERAHRKNGPGESEA
jgi:gas vesicle protein